jgi:hypothetical protein
MKILFVLLLTIIFKIVVGKKRIVSCEKGSDCLLMNLNPKPSGCMSMAGSQPICFHYEGNQNNTRNYKYDFNE